MIQAEDHINLVKKIVSMIKQLKDTEKIEDTEEYGDGLVGLTVAIQKYDASYGTQFSTFAWACIRNEIYRGIKSRRRYSGSGVIHLSVLEATDDEAGFEVEDYRKNPAEHRDIRRLLAKVLDLFPQELRHQINKRVLVDYFIHDQTLDQIASSLVAEYGNIGKTRERIRQRKEDALSYLRQKVEGEHLHVSADSFSAS